MNITYEITSSLLASLTAIYGLNYLYHKHSDVRSMLGSYQNQIVYVPLIYIGLAILISKFLDTLTDEDAKIRNYFSYIKGLLIGLPLAFLGIRFWKLHRILPIENPLMIYVYSAIFYFVFYGFIMEFIRNNMI
jgi:hypothetical protein